MSSSLPCEGWFPLIIHMKYFSLEFWLGAPGFPAVAVVWRSDTQMVIRMIWSSTDYSSVSEQERTLEMI